MRDDFLRRRRLKAPQLGIAAGVSFGLYAAFLTLAALHFPPFGKGFTDAAASLFPLYSVSYLGAFHLFWFVFLETFLLLWLTGTLYNALTRRGYGCRDWRRDQRKRTDGGEGQ